MPNPTSTFTSMVITFYPGTDDKDKDTRLEIFIITPPPGNPALAYYDDGRNDPIGDAAKSFTVPSVGSGFEFQNLTNQSILITIAPVGHDTWRFQFSAVLYFADGTAAKVARTGDLVLDQDANQLLYPLSGTVVSSGAGA